MTLLVSPSIFLLYIHIILKPKSSLMGKPRDMLSITTPLFNSFGGIKQCTKKKLENKNWNKEVNVALPAKI